MHRARSRAADPPRRSGRRRTWAYGTVAVVVIAAIAYLSATPLSRGRAEAQATRRDDAALAAVLDLRATLADWQLFLEPQIASLSPSPAVIDPTEIAKGAQLAQLELGQAAAATSQLRSIGFPDDARDVAAATAAFASGLTALGPLLAGKPVVAIARVIGAERASFVNARAVTATAASRLRTASAADTQESIANLDKGRVAVLVAEALAAMLAIGAALVVGQGLQRRESVSRLRAALRTYEASLQQALDMAENESDAYGVVTRALHESVPNLQVEMLVADSSHAHFHQTLHGDPDLGDPPRTGCDVSSPADCPATRRGHTLVFPSSRALNACPHLIGRASGELSAACVAVSITGQTSEVVHATGPDGAAPTERDVDYLEVTSHRASERIAMLRAFEKSEVQARTDPLTGLWNRRSLENRVRELARDGTAYALAYGDLDHFELLNDTHGHEAGDQALRLFSRVLRDSMRPDDLTARYGGEEFVVVLPGCPVDTALKVLERLRERLALVLTTGRVPAFTVSFGLASSTDGDTFDDVVAVADEGLLSAKANGRNRTVLTGASGGAV